MENLELVIDALEKGVRMGIYSKCEVFAIQENIKILGGMLQPKEEVNDNVESDEN